MLLFYAILYLGLSHAGEIFQMSANGEATIHESSQQKTEGLLDPFEGFKFTTPGKLKLKHILDGMFKKNIFIKKDDLDLNIKDDIMPWKPENCDKKEIRKRRKLRAIINFVQKHHFKGLHGGYTERVLDFPSDKNLGINDERLATGQTLVTFVHKNTPAEEMGVKKDWVVLKIGARPLKTTSDFHQILMEYKQKGPTVTMTFAEPDFLHVTDEDIERLSFGEFMNLLDMDFVKMSENSKTKTEL